MNYRITDWQLSINRCPMKTAQLSVKFKCNDLLWELDASPIDMNYMLLKLNISSNSSMFDFIDPIFRIKKEVILSMKDSHVLKNRLEKSINLYFKLNYLKSKRAIHDTYFTELVYRVFENLSGLTTEEIKQLNDQLIIIKEDPLISRSVYLKDSETIKWDKNKLKQMIANPPIF